MLQPPTTQLKGKSYYMKARDDKVRLIQCLPESNKGLNKDFLIMSKGWHDGLHFPTEEGGTRWGIQSRRGLTFCVIINCPVWLLT